MPIRARFWEISFILMLRWWHQIMPLSRIPINKTILPRKRGNGHFSMSDCECAVGTKKVNFFFDSRWSLAVKYYLLGNPINVWSSTLGIVLFIVSASVYLFRWQRHIVDFTPAYIDHIHYAGVYPVLGWALHYLPFFIMGRYREQTDW